MIQRRLVNLSKLQQIVRKNETGTLEVMANRICVEHKHVFYTYIYIYIQIISIISIVNEMWPVYLDHQTGNSGADHKLWLTLSHVSGVAAPDREP